MGTHVPQREMEEKAGMGKWGHAQKWAGCKG